jgi:hypothetical protein
MAKEVMISGNARSKNPVFSAFAPPRDGLDPFFSRDVERKWTTEMCKNPARVQYFEDNRGMSLKPDP